MEWFVRPIVRLVAAQVLFAACTVVCQQADDSILVGSFDIADPSLSTEKLQIPIVMEILPKIIARYDIVAFQGLGKTETTKALKGLVNGNTNTYELAFGTNVDRFAFFYRKSSVSIVNAWDYPNRNNTFPVPPVVVHVETKQSSDIGVADFLCIVVRTDSNPVSNLAMLQEMPHVITQAMDEARKRGGAAVPNVLLMGNLNADCSSLPFDNWQKIPLWTEGSGVYQWLLTRSVDTTTSSATSCAYDRFVAYGQALQMSVDFNSASVFRFDNAFALTASEVQSISSHYPIEVRLGAVHTLSNKPNQYGNPDVTIQTAPVGVTSKSDIAIWFDLATAMAPSVSFACRLDHISRATNCTSPFRRHSLEEGSHTLVITPSLPGNRTLASTSYSWTIDTMAPSVTNISHGMDDSNRPIVVFGCDEEDCLYECSLNTTLDDPGVYEPCWGGYRASVSLQLTSLVNLSVRAVDRAGNRGQPVRYTFLSGPMPVNTTEPVPTTAPSSNFLEDNLIFVACGCTALGSSMVWIVILLMCRTSSSDDDSKSSSEPRSAPPPTNRANPAGQDIAMSPVHTPPPAQYQQQLDVEETPADVDIDEDHIAPPRGFSSSMRERSGTTSPRLVTETPVMVSAAATTTTTLVTETTHFAIKVQPAAVGRESGDGQSLHDDNAVMEESTGDLGKISLLNDNVTYKAKQRLTCPSRSHRSSRCVCADKEEQVRLHNERKRERRRRRQYYNQHQHGLFHGGGGALTDIEQYNSHYRPRVRTLATTYSPGHHYQPIVTPKDEKRQSSTSSRADLASGSHSGDQEGSDGKPKLLDAMQRRKLAKRMMQERKAWTHYFANPSDGESVNSSMRSAPVLPSGLRLLTLNIDERRDPDPDTQSVVSGVTTCV